MALLFLLLFGEVNAFNRTRIHCLLNTILRPTLGHDDFSLFFCFVKCKYFWTKLNTAFATNTFFGVNHNNFAHGMISLFYMNRGSWRRPDKDAFNHECAALYNTIESKCVF